MQLETIRIKASDPAQGEFVVINASDFDASEHELFDTPKEQSQSLGDAPRKLGIQAMRDELTARGVEFGPDAKKADLQALLDQTEAQ